MIRVTVCLFVLLLAVVGCSSPEPRIFTLEPVAGTIVRTPGLRDRAGRGSHVQCGQIGPTDQLGADIHPRALHDIDHTWR